MTPCSHSVCLHCLLMSFDRASAAYREGLLQHRNINFLYLNAVFSAWDYGIATETSANIKCTSIKKNLEVWCTGLRGMSDLRLILNFSERSWSYGWISLIWTSVFWKVDDSNRPTAICTLDMCYKTGGNGATDALFWLCLSSGRNKSQRILFAQSCSDTSKRGSAVILTWRAPDKKRTKTLQRMM